MADNRGMTRRTRIGLWLAMAALGAAVLAAGSPAKEGDIAYSITLDGAIDPATEGWLGQGLEDAEDAGAALAIVILDTPGGLQSSMQEMVEDIIAAPMPVVVYVSPDGAQAASAGVFVTQAADVAAMAPQTRIGAASPVDLSGEDLPETLGEKVTNDAAAFARALADEHGRNGELAGQTVTEASSFTAEEALDAELIDIVATSEQDLLDQLDGFEVQGPKAQTLDTAGTVIESHDMPLQYELLQIIVNPNVAFLLLLVGLAGIAIELLAPGTIFPGTVGAICLLLGLIGTVQLPVTAVGVLLLLAGVAMVIAEAHLPTGGLLGAAGLAALVGSGLLLYDTNSDALEVDLPVLIVIVVVIGGLALLVSQRVYKAYRQERVMTGWEELIGAGGEVRAALNPQGQVFVEGALWRAQAAQESRDIERGERVRVVAVDGLTLLVEPDAGVPIESDAESEDPVETTRGAD
jgi:membrane-bound serine protease (ClpP class)